MFVLLDKGNVVSAVELHELQPLFAQSLPLVETPYMCGSHGNGRSGCCSHGDEQIGHAVWM